MKLVLVKTGNGEKKFLRSNTTLVNVLNKLTRNSYSDCVTIASPVVAGFSLRKNLLKFQAFRNLKVAATMQKSEL